MCAVRLVMKSIRRLRFSNTQHIFRFPCCQHQIITIGNKTSPEKRETTHSSPQKQIAHYGNLIFFHIGFVYWITSWPMFGLTLLAFFFRLFFHLLRTTRITNWWEIFRWKSFRNEQLIAFLIRKLFQTSIRAERRKQEKWKRFENKPIIHSLVRGRDN